MVIGTCPVGEAKPSVPFRCANRSSGSFHPGDEFVSPGWANFITRVIKVTHSSETIDSNGWLCQQVSLVQSVPSVASCMPGICSCFVLVQLHKLQIIPFVYHMKFGMGICFLKYVFLIGDFYVKNEL